MKRLFFIIVALFMLSCSNLQFSAETDYSVDATNTQSIDINNYDSLGYRQGFWETYSVINYRTDKGFLYYTEGHEYGYYIDDKKEGSWVAKDNDDKVIGYITYESGLRKMEVQFINNRIVSIIKIRFYPKQIQDTSLAYGELAELITFNKHGKIRSRFLLKGDSVVTKEFY